MTHAIVIAITNDGSDDTLDRIMAPFDESKEVPHTEIMSPQDMETMRAYYEGAISTIDFAKNNVDLMEHLRDHVDDWCSGQNARVITLADGSQALEFENLYNPQSKWDWWVTGGRWSPYFTNKDGSQGDETSAGNVDWEKTGVSYAVIDGRDPEHPNWLSKGTLGWFGMSGDESDDWPDDFAKLMASLPADIRLTAIDYHI